MSRICLYVDTENVPTTSWCKAFKELTSRDKIIVPITTHSNSVPLNIIKSIQNSKCVIELMQVATGTPNALDFILVSLLGGNIKSAPKTRHIIVSRDKGYDAVTKFWSTQGYDVCRVDDVSKLFKCSEVVTLPKEEGVAVAVNL